MKRCAVLATAALAWCLCLATQANAVTVWYQPTPFPSNVESTIQENLRHYSEGWVDTDETYAVPQTINPTLQQLDWVHVGGDLQNRFLTYLRFDLTGLPKNVDSALLYLMPGADTSPWTNSPYEACPVQSSWSSSGLWATLPTIGTCVGWYAAPTANQWSGIWLQYPGSVEWYSQWQNGTANNGIALYSEYADYADNAFFSSRYNDYPVDPYADARRPALQITFTPPVSVPNFQLPLPGGTSWQVTNEVGGYECMGGQPWPDTYHQEGNYFSIDFSPKNHDSNGNTVYTGNIPVIAAAEGVVTHAGIDDPDAGNGYYVVINHSYDNTNQTGFSTRYLHLQSNLQVHTGDNVSQGQLLGYMGMTGTLPNGQPSCTGVHLHFGMRYADDGHATSMVQYATMEGLLLKSYQTECGYDSLNQWTWIRYYPSHNVQVYPLNN